MQRTLEWTRSKNFEGFGCSQCHWKFNPLGVLAGDSLEGMKRTYEAQHNKEFATHTCVKRTSPTARMTK